MVSCCRKEGGHPPHTEPSERSKGHCRAATVPTSPAPILLPYSLNPERLRSTPHGKPAEAGLVSSHCERGGRLVLFRLQPGFTGSLVDGTPVGVGTVFPETGDTQGEDVGGRR